MKILVLNFYENDMAYLIGGEGFHTFADQKSGFSDDNFSGFFIETSGGSGGSDVFAVYSLGRLKCDGVNSPAYSNSCFLYFNGGHLDLADDKCDVEWVDGVLSRRFRVILGSEAVFAIDYKRAWISELMGRDRDSLHAGGDFFSYVAWAVSRRKGRASALQGT